MSKVVIERPRRKSWDQSPSLKTGRRIHRYDENNEYEDLPKHEKYSMNWQGGKYHYKNFSDLIGPLERYLRSNVGRPWDKVYSELCEHLDRRKTTGRHIFEHVEGLVSLHCYIGADGKLYDRHGWYSDRPVTGLYVHPRTRLLCWKARASEKQRKRAARAALPVTCISVAGDQYYIKVKGLWYLAELTYNSRSVAELQAAGYHRPELFECYVHSPTLQIKSSWGDIPYKNSYWVLSKRQLSAKELKAARLSNDVA